jgi:hypothetical protein
MVKWFFGVAAGKVVKHGFDHGGREFLGGKTIAAADILGRT